MVRSGPVADEYGDANDGTDDDDDDECVELVSRDRQERVSIPTSKRNTRKINSSTDVSRRLKVVAGVVLLSTCAIMGSYFTSKGKTSEPSVDAQLSSGLSDDDLIFTCPSQDSISDVNYDPDTFDEDYVAEGTQPETDNMTEFKSTFRTVHFDGRRESYENFVQYMTDFKLKYFAPYLKSGDSIYESACGIGLNMYATLEILSLGANITGLNVYGNEYLAVSAQRANRIFDFMFQEDGNGHHLGSVCAADSSNLDFAPSNSFDLVFTGFISPLWDPLNFDLEYDENYHKLKKLCKAPGDDWEAQILVRAAQERQEQWFNKWITSMIRIAKPGAPVIFELVAPPYCEILHDFGGVNHTFWETGVERYGWDIDQDSIEFAPSESSNTTFRYHTFMLKNK